MKKARRLFPLVAGLLLLAGCGGSASPQPSAASPAASAPASAVHASSPAASPSVAAAPASAQASGAATSGSSAAAPAASGAAASVAAPTATGELVFAVQSFGLENMDPSQGPNLATGNYGGPIFEALYMIMPPNGDIEPYLLQTSTMAPDAMSWTLKLKDGIKFSNGDPMTADDVKFSLDRYLSPESKSSSKPQLQAAIKSVDVVDPLTVRVNLKQPTIDLPNLLAYPGNEGVIVPSKYVQQVGWDGFAKKPIGSGPYVLAEHKVGESFTYTPNPNYWRSKPTLSKISLLLVPEESTRIAMLKSGKADLIQISADTKQSVEAGGFKTLISQDTSTYMLHFAGNWDDYPNTPLKNLNVRKALTMAIDKKAIEAALDAGAGSVANFGPSAPGVSPGAPDFAPTPYDPNQAKQLLQQAGYSNLNLKIWDSDAACPMDLATKFDTAVAGYWQQIGVTPQIVPTSYTILRPKIMANPYAPDIPGTVFNFCLGPQEAIRDLVTFFYSKGPIHVTGIADDDIAKALSAKTLDEQHQYTESAYKKLADYYPSVAVFYASSFFAADAKAASYPMTRAYPTMLSWWVKDVP